MENFYSSNLSIVVIGHPTCYFPCKRGVRKVHPFFLSFGCLAINTLSIGVSQLICSVRLQLMFGSRFCPTPSVCCMMAIYRCFAKVLKGIYMLFFPYFLNMVMFRVNISVWAYVSFLPHEIANFQPLGDHTITKLCTWKGPLLLIMGRVQLVKCIIHGMLSYSLNVCLWTITLPKYLGRCIINFI